MLKRDYKKGTFDLADLDLHNGIEHDWSLTRMRQLPWNTRVVANPPLVIGEDSAVSPDQSKPHVPFIKELLASASGKDKDGNVLLTPKDLSEFSAKRRVESRESNPHFTTSLFHRMFGSSKCVRRPSLRE